MDNKGTRRKNGSGNAILLPETRLSSGENCANRYILGAKCRASKKCHISSKKLLRSPAPVRKYRLTEADNTAAGDGMAETPRSSDDKNEGFTGGRAKKVSALPVDFVSQAL
ncbi:MAG: hypothetical protein WBO29_06845 [Albidovulum sp.]